MIALYILGGWVGVALVVGFWASVRLHRDPEWVEGTPRVMGTWFPSLPGGGDWSDWPGNTPTAIVSSLIWPGLLVLLMLPAIGWGLYCAAKALLRWPFEAFGRSMAASKPNQLPTTWLKKR